MVRKSPCFVLLWACRVLLKFLWEPHFLLALPDVALERETDGDLLLADMGEVKYAVHHWIGVEILVPRVMFVS